MPSHPRLGLRGLIVVCMVAIAVAPSLVILPMLANLSRSITQRQASSILQTVTLSVAEQLSNNLKDQWQEVKRLAAFAEQDVDADKLRLRLDTIVATNAQYAWLGLADPAGKVLVSSDGVLRGANVAERPWFKAGLSNDFAGDVHDALLLQKVLEPNAREPLRLIDFALPVRRGDGVPVGVLGAHVRWQSVRELFGKPRGDGSIEIMLLSQDGTVLVGPKALEEKKVPLASVLSAGQGIARSSVETWGDGERYLTTAVPALSLPGVPSFGWSIVGRQPVALALVDTYAATARLLPVVISGGVGIVLVSIAFGWWVARPLRRLTDAAEQLGAGTLAAPVPHERFYREVSMLSDALARIDSRGEGKPRS